MDYPEWFNGHIQEEQLKENFELHKNNEYWNNVIQNREDNLQKIKDKMGMFDIIYEDAPWWFSNWNIDELTKRGLAWAKQNGRSPYPAMTKEGIEELPIYKLAGKDCARFTWVTFPKIEDALNYINYYVNENNNPIFKYKTVAFVWLKLNKRALDNFKKLEEDMSREELFNWVIKKGFFFGMGYWTHGNVEVCFLSTKGSPKRLDKDISQLIIEPLQSHSTKPAIVREKIDKLVVAKNKIELFARPQNLYDYNWLATGFDWDGYDIKEILK